MDPSAWTSYVEATTDSDPGTPPAGPDVFLAGDGTLIPADLLLAPELP